MAQWRYFLGTGDADWLRQCGYPVLRDVADFWASRVSEVVHADQYEIRDVTGPNGAIAHVDDDAYTNAIARRVMEAATEAAHRLGVSAKPEWARIAPKIVLPFDPQNERHLEHAGDFEGKYAHTVPMLSYPLEMDLSGQVKRNDLDLALRNFGKPGYEVGMLGNFYSIVACELGDGELAYRLFLETMRSYAKPPFYAMSETPGNNRFTFLTAEGALLQQVIFGFMGLRLSSDGLSPRFRPILPPDRQSLELRGINLNGKRRTVRVQPGGKLTIE